MTKKHFKAFAKAISQIRNLEDREIVARTIAAVCRQQNNRFDYNKFYLACGLDDDGHKKGTEP